MIEERMSDRQAYLLEEVRAEEELSGVVGDGLGLGEEAYEGELEERRLKAAAGPVPLLSPNRSLL